MKLKHFLSCVLFFAAFSQAFSSNNRYDLVIVGGTPGGLMAAIAAARENKSSLILERTTHIGGLPANGLGATDIETRGATTGLFGEFVGRIKSYYIDKYGIDSQQVKDCSDGYHFEPSVAERVFLEMLGEYGTKITVLYNRQFDADPVNIEKSGTNITSVTVLNRESGQMEKYNGKVFIDATYEGDLGAAANIPFRVGRESRAEFDEVCAGKIYRQWGAQHLVAPKQMLNGYLEVDSEGTTYLGDNAVQSYNYRLCLTTDKQNMRPVERPANYNRDEYTSLIDDVWLGSHGGVAMRKVTPEMQTENREKMKKGERTSIPDDPWGIAKITNMVTLPNSKTDANNQHMALISTDLPEENWPWPTAGWEWRDAYAQRLKKYILGLVWFAQNDKELPKQFREACKEWGLSTTEYADNNNFPRQVYVREGRRFEGLYFFTAKDALPVAIGQRPPVHKNSITASHYALDSHAVLKREEGRAHLDGFFSQRSEPYTVPFGVIASEKVDNLLFPVPVSGSHVGFSTLRMEPCWMAMGEAAGIVSAQMIDRDLSARSIDMAAVQKLLIKNKATLIYFKDMTPANPAFEMVQYMGLQGYLPEWEAALDQPVSDYMKRQWQLKSGVVVPENLTTRGEVLHYIYERVK